MVDERLRSTAYHEAGHVIIAQALGVSPDFVEVEYNDLTSRWEGTTCLPVLTDMTLEEKCVTQLAICFAGCFAQVKYSILAEVPGEPIPWKELFNWTVSKVTAPLQVVLSNSKTFEVPCWWFEGPDEDNVLFIADGIRQQFRPENLNYFFQRAVAKVVVPVLEDATAWTKVGTLADLLVSSVTGKVRRLTGGEIPN